MNVAADFWSALPTEATLDSEANVEHRFVLPLLHSLGYRSEDIESKYPVDFQRGRRGRKHEADFVCFYGPIRDRSNSLLVIEAKPGSEPLVKGKAQGESYAHNLRTPLLVLTNGRSLEIWQIQVSMESECVLQIPLSELASHRGDVERLLNKTAVRDYCVALKFKTIVEATSDFGVYETAEFTRLKSGIPVITRALRAEAAGIENAVDSTSLLQAYPSGAVVLAPSGYGKTILSRSILRQAIEERWRGTHKSIAFDVPLPVLAAGKVDLLTFLHGRVAAHQPGVTLASLADSLRKIGATIVCDGLDRTSREFQLGVRTQISLFLRDYPLSQFFLFGRAGSKPLSTLPVLTLMPLSTQEVREIENLILTDGSATHWSIIGAAPPTLRALCSSPLLLRLVLEFWKREHDFPRNLEGLFRSWLEAVLETEPDDLIARAYRESALSSIAEATGERPLSSIEAINLLKHNGIPVHVLEELVRCNAVQETNATLEVVHESLADYLRAKELAKKSVQLQLVAIDNLALAPDSFLPVLLTSLLVNPQAQSALWLHLVTGPVATYLDALRYRFDASEQLKSLEPDQLSERYLTELLNGIEEPLDGFFPALRPAIVEWLTQERSAGLAIIGSTNGHALHYKIYGRESDQARVTVGVPAFPGTIRGVDLDLSRYRIDSARVLGMALLRKGLEKSLDALNIAGGVLWAHERLIARVRVLNRRYEFPISVDDELEKIEGVVRPFADEFLDEGALVGRERFAFKSILNDIETLRASGMTALDPWWSRLGWKDDGSFLKDDVVARVLDEEYRRVQLTYAEIVRISLERHAGELSFFPILPIRWNLTVKRRQPAHRTFVIYPRWKPVRSWSEAGADVVFADNAPEQPPPWEGVRDALVALGRPPNVMHYGGFTTHFGYDGSAPNGYFGGATPVAHEVMSWLRDELGRLFRNLPSGDRAFAV